MPQTKSLTKSYAAPAPKQPLAPWSFERRDPRPNDVAIAIAFCGVCHSDVHQARDEWFPGIYPMVPGHEIVGTVTAVGSNVKNFKPGDLAAVGVMIDSCRKCANCKAGLEQYCTDGTGATMTYNGRDRQGEVTQGGYSKSIVVDANYVLHVSSKLNAAAVAPLLCAGITTYSPLKHWGAGPGKKVGIVGLGGLGHMGLKFAHSLGAHTVLFTTSKSKVEDGKRLGADEVILSNNEAEMKKHAGSFDMILDAVSAPHDLNALLTLLKLDGTMMMVGLPDKPFEIAPFNLLSQRRSVAGSGIGGIAETQEMLDYCAEKNIVSDVEVVAIDQINEAWERMIRQDVKYRFVIDMATLK